MQKVNSLDRSPQSSNTASEPLPTNADEISDKERELYQIIFLLGHSCWKQFCGTPRGLMLRLVIPNEAAWRRAEELFLTGFGDRMIGENYLHFNYLSSWDDFETLWQIYLESSEGEILLDGPEYPGTPECVLDAAKRFYFLGYLRADILLED